MSDQNWFKTGFDKIEEEATRNTYEFSIKDGEQATVRFLSNDPRSFRRHELHQPPNYPRYTCRQGMEGGCPLCDAGHKTRFVGLLPVYDYRDKKIKPYVQGVRALRTLDQLSKLEPGLTGQDVIIMRSGKSTDTTYNFAPKAPSPMPSEVLDPNGQLSIPSDIFEQYAPKSVDELRSAAQNLPSDSQRNPSNSPNGQPNMGGSVNKGFSF